MKPRFRRQSEPPLTEEQREAWRGKVGSKVVEFAWEKLCGSLVQQWVRNIIPLEVTLDSYLIIVKGLTLGDIAQCSKFQSLP